MLIARFMVVLFLLLSSACATRHALRVGDTRVIIEKTQHGVGKNFIHVHQNETTALRAAKAVVAQEDQAQTPLQFLFRCVERLHYHCSMWSLWLGGSHQWVQQIC